MVKQLMIAGALLFAGFSLHAGGAKWKTLFNGDDLSGWTVKIRGAKAGENPGNIFRVDDGLLTVSYDAFDEFGSRFGHLFLEKPYENYRLRLEYRFIGEQKENAPKWAYRNSGIMIHGQSPESMEVDQNFPECIEIQLLGAYEDGRPRTTGNLLPLRKTITMKNGGTTTKPIRSTAACLPAGKWVEAEVLSKDGVVKVFINGKLVAEGSNALSRQDQSPMRSGYISLQAESHPVQFRKIEIREFK